MPLLLPKYTFSSDIDSHIKSLFLAWLFRITADPTICSYLILQNRMFSLPHETRLFFSMNSIFFILKSLVYFATVIVFIRSLFWIKSYITMTYWFLWSRPTVAILLDSLLKMTSSIFLWMVLKLQITYCWI